MLISLSDNLKYSLNYVMCEYIGTYRYSSKSVALRLKIKQSCWVGIVFSINKPHDNIDDGSTTFKVVNCRNIVNDDKVFY